MRRKTLTKAQIGRRRALKNTLDATINSAYRAAPDCVTPFSECLKLATAEVRVAYQQARDDLDAFERDMIAEGRAWRALYGMFTPY